MWGVLNQEKVSSKFILLSPHSFSWFSWITSLFSVIMHNSGAGYLSCMYTYSHVPFHTDTESSDAIRDSAHGKIYKITVCMHSHFCYKHKHVFLLNLTLILSQFWINLL